MGGFYGSIHVRTSDRQAVLHAAEEVARSQQVRCLVGPTVGDWVGVYPENGGQDERFGADLASRLGGPVLHLLVHDDDLLAYWLYRDGAAVDSFHSRPGYFGQENFAAEEAMQGDPKLLAELADGDVEAIERLLVRGDDSPFTFESERMAQLAKRLGIANAVSAYEYLKEGERHGITGWRQFAEVPAGEAARKRDERRKRTAKIRDAKKRANKDGLLLDEQACERMSRPIWCAVDDAFWLRFVHTHEEPSVAEFQVLGADRSAGETIQIEVGGPVFDIVASDSGDLVAISSIEHGAAAPRWRIGAWETAGGKCKWHRPVGSRPSNFDDKAERLLLCEHNEVDVLSTADGSSLAERRWTQGSHPSIVGTCLHPEGRTVVVNEGIRIVAMDLDRPGSATMLFLGGIMDLSSLWPAESPTLDIEKVLDDLRTQLERSIGELKSRGIKVPDGVVEAELEKARAAFAAAKKAPPLPRQAKARVDCMAFGRDGDLIFFGTDKGLMVYRYDELLGGGTPLWHFVSELKHPNGRPIAEVSALAEDPTRREVVFAGRDGRVRALSLETGAATTVLEMPEKLFVHRLDLTRDGRCMAFSGRVDDEEATLKRREQTIWQMWNYARLRELAGNM